MARRHRKDKDSTRDKDVAPKRTQRKERDPNLPKQTPRTLESKRIFDPDQLMDEETLAQMDSTDEFAAFFVGDESPKILVTTTRRPRSTTHTLAEELSDFFPNAEYKPRASHMLVKDVVKGAVQRSYTHLIIVNESRKVLGTLISPLKGLIFTRMTVETLSVVKLPEGPTAIFQLTSVKLSKEIHNHGRSTSHTPELILNNFVTKLGHRVGRLFVSLFPHVPQFTGRQVVTFHNQRDFIFVRRHRYIFDDEGRRARMQEIGPQFTLKLKKIVKATSGLLDADVEYEWKAHAVDSKKFAI